MRVPIAKSLVSTIAVILSVAVVGLASGLSISLLSLRMAQAGYSTWLIGLMAAAPAAGFIMAAPWVSALTQRFSRKHVVLACFVASASSIALLEVVTTTAWWLPLRLIMGMSAGIIITLGETWINELATDSSRGRVVATYATTFTLCQFLGPTILAFLGTATIWPIVIACGFHIVAAGSFLVLKNEPPQAAHSQHTGLSISRFLRYAPALSMGILFFAFFDAAVLALLPVYGLHHGLSTTVAISLVSVVLLGDTALQMPLGWLADKLRRSLLHRTCGLVALILTLALPLTMTHSVLLYPLLAILGAAAGGVYTLALIQIGQHYQGNDLVTANAAAGMLWGAGSLLGPLLGGAAATWGSNGLPILLALLAALFVASTFMRHRTPAAALSQ